MNWDGVDQAQQPLLVEVPAHWADAEDEETTEDTRPEFIKNILIL